MEDVVSVLTDEASKTSRLVGNVTPEQLGLPTPCADWDVRTLINHLCLGADFFARVAAGDQAQPDYETDFVGDDPAAAYDQWKATMVEACSAPGLAERPVHLIGTELPGTVVLGLALMDTVVHRWDLARAIGADPDIPEQVAALVLEQVRSMIPEEMRAPAPDQTTGSVPFGPVIDAPDDASAVDRLVAFLGRRP